MLDGHVATIELSRPPHNYVDAASLTSLADCFASMDANDDVRCILLTSRGKSFCAGADFSTDEGSGDTAREFYMAASRLFAGRKPVVAAIQGAAIGAGMGLALLADFRIATPQARFSANFVKLGIHPGFGLTHSLPRLIGQQKAAMLLYTGRRIDGKEAQRIGLVDSLVEASDLHDCAMALAQEIAQGAPLAVIATRATLRDGLADAVSRQMAHEASEQERLFVTDDFKEGMRAVAERRPGHFFAR
ncbi:enoyl-CoA hydratase/isomerase family protein [Sphingobium sp. CR2-8]|uniref:enoyl-CoA hydratase/isomerase family protein n=1 Tax=Sphingobium sp. CR2-8 TaxID=1306534 RepID=UPI002DBC9AD9|nr:enoyl-CoA hydratase/isomerase family protein [Sphingobium sp. CR2-8]MEC3909519.1 enoyl-CoA hydratase/isomerase family protein [Sphingobium sp. CR2-8]